MHGVDEAHTSIGYAAGFRYSELTKALEIQVVTKDSGTGGSSDAGFAKAICAWCLVAPPQKPTRDLKGNVSAACDVITSEVGDQTTVVGTRDTRVAKYAQDAKGGEVVLTTAYGARLAMLDSTDVLDRPFREVSLSAGGGTLSFDLTSKTVALIGIPPLPGKGAPYLTIGTTSIGMVSETGAASWNVHGAQITGSGSGAALNFGSVGLGTGAADPVVMNSLLTATLAVLMAWANTHTHIPLTPAGAPFAGAPVTSPPVVPLVLSMLNGSVRVKTA